MVTLALRLCEVTAAEATGYGRDPARQAVAMSSSVVSKYRALPAVERWLNSFQSIKNCFGDPILSRVDLPASIKMESLH